jgi:hypothetical protein
MSAITRAFVSRLKGDPTLTGYLSTWKGRPSVFPADPVPVDVAYPWIVCAAVVADSAFDTKTGNGRDHYRDVACYAPATGSTEAIEAIAERVRALFHRHRLAVSGYGTILCSASGPIVAPTDSSVYGRIVTVRWLGYDL